MTSKRLGIVMDDISKINFAKDSSLAMLWAATDYNFEIFYISMAELFLQDSKPYAYARKIKVFKDAARWVEFVQPAELLALEELAIILMRKDPPFNENFLTATYILQAAEALGVKVVNKPQALRDANEKVFATEFAKFCAPHLVSCNIVHLRQFWQDHQDIVVKPLDSMGGNAIFRLQAHDVNVNAILTELTQHGQRYIMAQRYIPEIIEGDKRILLINGEPIPYALARIPQGNDWRGNLAMGAKGVVQELSAHDLNICQQLGPVLKQKGLYFVGIDVIGNYLTEINVTSPTGIQEIQRATNINIAHKLFDAILT